MSDDLVKQLRDASTEAMQAAWRRTDGGQDLALGATLADEAADRIEALTEQLAAAHQDADEAEAYAWKLEQELGTCRMAQAVMDNTVADLEAKLTRAAKALESLIQQTHNCEKELTEDLHHVDYCGESEPLTKARTTLAELKGQDDE